MFFRTSQRHFAPIFASFSWVDVNLVAEGDSLTAGVAMGETLWLTQLISATGCTGSNQATAGHESSQVSAVNVNAQWNAAKTNICVLWIGSNDAAEATGTTNFRNNVEDFCEALWSAHAGWTVLLLNIPWRSDLSDVTRASYNAAGAAAAPIGGTLHRLDIATIVGDQSDNPTWWITEADYIHFTTTGHGVVRAAIQSAIEGILT